MKRIFIIFLALCMAFTVCACADTRGISATAAPAVLSSAPLIAAPTTPSLTPAPTQTPQPSPTAAEAPITDMVDLPEDPAEKYIASAFYVVGHYQDSIKNKYPFTFDIPELVLDSRDIDALNVSIYDALYPYVEDAHGLMDEGLSLMITAIEYNAYLNDDILSLVVRVSYDYDYTEYYVWNVSVKDKKPIEAETLFAKTDLGADGSTLYDVTAGTVGKYYFDKYDKLTDPTWVEHYKSTMETENLSKAQYYMDENGVLQSIVKIFVPVGSGCYNAIIELTK